MIRTLFTVCCLLALSSAARAQAPRPQEVLGQDRLVTLSEAVAIALENNLNLQVERLDPAIARERVREAEGVFEPSLVALYDRTHLETPVASAVQNAFSLEVLTTTTEDYYTYNGGLQGILPWGLSYSSGYTMQLLDSTSAFYALKPQYLATWRSDVTLPLLRNLYWSTADLLVRRSYVSKDITDDNFRANLSNSVLALESAYWELAAARSLETAGIKSVETAEDLLEQTKVQYQVGVVSKVRVTEAEAGLAQRDFDLIVRSNRAQAAQDALLTAMLEPGLADYSSTYIRTEEPTFVPYEVNADAALEKARALRPELAAAQNVVRNAEFDEKYAWNQKLPALDVRGTYTNAGIAGSQKPTVISNLRLPEQRWAADNEFFEGSGDHSWGIAANLEVPIGNDTLDARYVQSKILLRRAKTNLRLEEQNVIVDVRNSVRELQSSIDGVKAAQRARIASEETLRAEQERLRLGDSTPHTVLEFDEDLRLAESNEIRALQVYRTAIAALERAQGTLLDKLGIDVVQERERGVGEF